MKDQQKYITSIVLLVAVIYFIGEWLKNWLGGNVASIITSIGTMSFLIYGIYFIWDRWLWKHAWLSPMLCKIVGFYDYPCIAGRWEISYESSYNNSQGTGEAVITQNYSSLFIEGTFGQNSSFESFFAQLKQKESGKWFLVYAYRNKPQSKKLTGSLSGGMHEGFVYLDIKNLSKLEGYYSNDDNRKTRGKLVLNKKASKF